MGPRRAQGPFGTQLPTGLSLKGRLRTFRATRSRYVLFFDCATKKGPLVEAIVHAQTKAHTIRMHHLLLAQPLAVTKVSE